MSTAVASSATWADRVAVWLDPLCTWVDDDAVDECGAGGTVFAVGAAHVVVEGLESTIRRDVSSPLVFACPVHLVASITASEDPTACSVVMPVAEHPLRGRPAVSR